jgi:3-methyladenine DNA glycosylase Tag
MSVTENMTPGHRPASDAGYLEMMTMVIFMGGLNRQVVEGKWEGFLDAFEHFAPGRVADFTEEDVERLSEDERIIRYAAKIKAVVKNARTMLDISDAHGSFGRWLMDLVQSDGVDVACETLAKRFSYISENSARRYLFAVGEDVGEVSDKVKKKYGAREV